jgi:subtilisin family serine protease/PKD repeat protein
MFNRHHLLRNLLGLALFIGLTSAAFAAESIIVELNQEPAAMAAARARAAGTPMSDDQIETYRQSLSAAQDQFLAALDTAGIPYTVGGQDVDSPLGSVRVPFRYTLVFNGINLVVPGSSIPAIEQMPQVRKVHPDEMLYTTLDRSVPYVRAPEVYGAIHELTPFDDFREGFEGQGIYVSIIDTGVEWFHEQFGGDLTPPRLGVEPATSGKNGKVVYYLPLGDLVVEDGVGHGTHVAATAAGYLGFAPGPDRLPLTDDDIALHGVAPQAKILSYKVCSDAVSIPGSLTGVIGGCLSAAITMALEDSVSPRTINGFPKPVAHVINLSLGGSGTPDSVTAIAADNAHRAGAVVVAAAGNSGPGAGTAGAPCVGRLVTCVANSIDPSGAWTFDVLSPTAVNRLIPGAVTPASHLPAASGERQQIQLISMSGTPAPPAGSVAQYYVYVVGGETPLAYPPSVSGRIALVSGGGLPATFGQIANSAAAAGAVAVILRSETANPTAVIAPIPGANLPPEQFDYLVSLMNAGATPPNGTLSTHPIRLNSFYSDITLNSSSSRGPVAGFGQVKPDITAPGTSILAAVPPASLLGALAQSNYASINGTSMASPHVAGAAALVRQAHPSWSPDMIRTALMNTSTNLRDNDGVPKEDGPANERVLSQGAGLLDVYAAVNAQALMGVSSNDPMLPTILGSHSFGVVPAINAQAVVTRTVTVTMQDVSGAAGTYDLAIADNHNLHLSGVSASVTPSSVELGANETATFEVAISIDGNAITSGDLLEVEWYVRAARRNSDERLGMPFYLRATPTLPAAAVLHPIEDDAIPDQENGIDRDGNYLLRWSYPGEEQATPCGYRIEETLAGGSGTLYYDDAEELMLNGVNSQWSGSFWNTAPHPGTGSMGYATIYIDQNTAAITSGTIALPNAQISLTFASFEDIELDFDYGHVDVSEEGGTWRTLATYTGFFSGERSLDLSEFAGSSVRIRFRLVSDQLVSFPAHLGWFIDDIRIQSGAAFDTIAEPSWGTNTLEVNGRSDGTYAYRVVALFGNCASDPFATTPSNVEQITVSIATAPPVASFTSSPNPSNIGESVTFDASASHDQDQVGGAPGIVQYHWSFGDGTTRTTPDAVTTHTYAAAGSYRVTLTVTDNDGESASTESIHTVRQADASISGGGHLPSGDRKVTFGIDVATSGGVPSGSFVWNDHAQKVKIRSTSISDVSRSGNQATVTAGCTINKSESATCVITLVDNGETGDTISLEAGDYAHGGTLSGGGIEIQ